MRKLQISDIKLEHPLPNEWVLRIDNVIIAKGPGFKKEYEEHRRNIVAAANKIIRSRQISATMKKRTEEELEQIKEDKLQEKMEKKKVAYLKKDVYWSDGIHFLKRGPYTKDSLKLAIKEEVEWVMVPCFEKGDAFYLDGFNTLLDPEGCVIERGLLKSFLMKNLVFKDI